MNFLIFSQNISVKKSTWQSSKESPDSLKLTFDHWPFTGGWLKTTEILARSGVGEVFEKHEKFKPFCQTFSKGHHWKQIKTSPDAPHGSTDNRLLLKESLKPENGIVLPACCDNGGKQSFFKFSSLTQCFSWYERKKYRDPLNVLGYYPRVVNELLRAIYVNARFAWCDIVETVESFDVLCKVFPKDIVKGKQQKVYRLIISSGWKQRNSRRIFQSNQDACTVDMNKILTIWSFFWKTLRWNTHWLEKLQKNLKHHKVMLDRGKIINEWLKPTKVNARLACGDVNGWLRATTISASLTCREIDGDYGILKFHCKKVSRKYVKRLERKSKDAPRDICDHWNSIL